MEKSKLKNIIELAPQFISFGNFWSNYDKEADVLYINFDKPSIADDSEMREDDTIIRYYKNKIVGVTVLNAKKKSKNFHA
jgi:uncharacterized protein YuzE